MTFAAKRNQKNTGEHGTLRQVQNPALWVPGARLRAFEPIPTALLPSIEDTSATSYVDRDTLRDTVGDKAHSNAGLQRSGSSSNWHHPAAAAVEQLPLCMAQLHPIHPIHPSATKHWAHLHWRAGSRSSWVQSTAVCSDMSSVK